MSFQYLTVLIVIMNMPIHILSDYLYRDLSGNILDSQFNFSMNIRRLNGIIFYARDEGGGLLMRSYESKSTVTIAVLGDEKLAKETIKDMCGCEYCLVKVLNVFSRPAQNNFIINCNGKTTNVTMNRKSTWDFNPFEGLPSPNLNEDQPPVHISMGNIGQFVKSSNQTINLFQDQLVGCLRHFQFNNQSINMITYGRPFLSQCGDHLINETVCRREHCSTMMIPRDILNCSIMLINSQSCKREKYEYRMNLSEYRADRTSLMRTRKNGNNKTEITLLWKQKQLGNFCLMEVKLKDGRILVLRVNESLGVVMHIVNVESVITESRMMNGILSNDINVMQTIFAKGILVLKMIGDNIYTYIDEPFDEPMLINAGRSDHTNHCLIFEGEMDLQYPTSEFRLNSSNGNLQMQEPPFSTFTWSVIIVCFLIVSFVAQVVIIAIIKGYQCFSPSVRQQNKPDSGLDYEMSENIYETTNLNQGGSDYSTIPD